MIEGDARGDAHAFNPLLGAAIRRDPVNGAVVAAGDEEVAVAIEGQPGGIDQRSDERLDAVVGGDFVKRNGYALAARPAEGHVDIPVGVDRWVGDRMKIIRDLHGDGNRMWLAFALRRGYAHRAAVGVVRDARNQSIICRENQAGLRFAKVHDRARAAARSKAAAVNDDFAAGDGGGWRDAVDAGEPVFFRGAETEFHTRLKCSARRSRIAA